MTVAVDGQAEAPAFAAGTSEGQVVAIVRAIAREIGGDRAAAAVTPTASLERDVGLGSLERVELLMRLESLSGRELGDRFLVYDSVREIVAALPEAPLRRDVVVRPSRGEGVTGTTVRVDDVTTLVDALARRATAEPMRTHVLLHEGETIQRVSYAALWDGAARIAAGLRERGVARGEPVAIMLPTGLDYLQSFMGVLTAGAIAVPLYPPARLDRMAEYLERQSRILANAGARVLVAMPEAAPVARLLHGAAPALSAVVTAASLRESDPAPATVIDGGDAALVQYTSGSTGDPKGVLLTHANLLANIRAISDGIQLRPTDAAVSWLPLYHDMGLIGTWLDAMVHGIPLTLMSPLAFLARPERWLWAIHAQRATLSAAPNFAYELCVRKIPDEALAGLDLSPWRAAFNGSEPVSPATIDRFLRRFERYGFRRESLVPVYGLAESAVALTVPPLGRAPLVDVIERDAFARDGRAVPALRADEDTLRFVSVGRPFPGHEVRLVDERGADVAERTIGKLVFRGPSCMSGYFHNPDATARVLLPDGWIDSGDLAYRSGNELFIAGRVKDLIMKGGRNLVPQAIEEVVGGIPGIRKGCVAAFGVADEAAGTERIVVIAESHARGDAERTRLEREAVAAVAAQTGVPPDVVCIVPPGTVPKTPSGKIRRAAARASFISGHIEQSHRMPLSLRLGLAGGALAQRGRRAASAVARGVQVCYLVLVWSLAAIIVGPFALAFLYLLPEGRPVRALSRGVSRLLLAISGCRLEIDGSERIPRTGPVVLVTNHASYADSPVLAAALPIDFTFVAMREILDWPVIGTIVRRGWHPTVDRWHVEQSLADARVIDERLHAGDAVLFFAEGGFSAMRGLKPFRLGAFRAAVAAGAPVVPVALRGSREILPADTRMPHPRRVHVWIGGPLHADGTGWDAAVALRDRAADAVAAHCGEPRLEAPAPAPAPPLAAVTLTRRR